MKMHQSPPQAPKQNYNHHYNCSSYHLTIMGDEEVIREKGLEHVTVEDLVVEITPKGRALVPDSVKKELLQRIRAFLAQHAA
ncbi:Transcription and mRNA export factor ENY2-2 [Oryzias melastigma]|uniref:Transcription and mRNA export factor ENY2-2 n=1 Tax=Oryzias melastigma TaxID=30732 RepID=A0A834FSV6_ORYME|nr:Transcription and mRNA export factor ENY2-2 [Oryzias melastigma]